MLSGPSTGITDISCCQPSVSEYYQTQSYKNALSSFVRCRAIDYDISKF